MADEFTLPDKPNPLPDTITPSSKDSVSDDEQEFTLSTVEFSIAYPEGRYQLLHEIARGGVGVVISAYDRLLRRQVAIKLLLRKFLDQPHVQQQFIEEALLTSSLQHPSIIPIYDRGYALDNRPFFVMKLVSGVSLAVILTDSRRRQLERLRLLKYFEQICQTVSYAHSQGILHLDIKPANIMIGDFGEVLLMDWGQAKWWKPIQETITADTTVDPILPGVDADFHAPMGTGGTPAYMPPEQACGEVVSPASDIFSLGAMLYEILLGHPPYIAPTPKTLLKSVRRGDTVEAFRELESSGCDSQLLSIVKRCLSKDAAERPAEACIVAEAISNYLETALEQAESDRCRFFDLTLDMFCIATLEGYFVRLNPNFTRVLGYSEPELLSQPFLNFVHPADRPDTLEVMKRLLRGEPVIQFCNRYRHANGHYLVFEWTAQSLPSEGNIFAVARDITNRPTQKFLDGQ